MRILAIETSCDETACAVVDVVGKTTPHFTVLSNVISSQVKLHAPYGGVVPTLASREHLKNIPHVFKKALSKASTTMEDIDVIAVTYSPGLVIALLIGVSFARGLGYAYGKKIIPVHHVAAHIYSNWLSNTKIVFPLLNIVVSGGHTELVLMKRLGSYTLLGETRDDAAGEAFDKVAKMLNLGYPGGPAISACGKNGDASRFVLPRPMIASGDYDFSFSGLKTAVIHCIKKHPEIMSNKTARRDFCASFEQAVADVITKKTMRAAQEYHVKTIALSGGVSANTRLREQLTQAVTTHLRAATFIVPARGFSTDNAAMIAAAAYFTRARATTWKNIDASAHAPLR
ncbi:MAG: tRNA (adenosine(37)-N6)-threonylcarbamoyltransferase complex transferase subunit TsaD [Candidatus Azambacteria bacterium]|nr:tRNA (adenosine(37)-N6)-threonylcarbamoyltransferase complex transferase subunit TsaD [Candidatus Azambacteria bacterium]